MKTLPDLPNLDHLRQQAKELLGGLRQARPDVTLSAAQTLLAQEYGYHDWTELKAEVDRRRADVSVADADVTAAVAVAFDLGRPTGPMRAQELAWAGQVWALTTDRGAWRVTEFYDYTPASNIEHEFRVVEAAAAAGIATTEPVRDREGRPLAELAGRTWRVHRELALGPTVIAPVTPETAARIGEIVGTLHRLRLPAPGPVHTWLTCRPGEELWQKQLDRSREDGAPWTDQLERALPALLGLSEIVDDRDPAEEPILSHGSPGPGAFHRRNGHDLVLTNWDHACAIPPGWELASVLDHWGVDPLGDVSEPTVRGVIKGYREALGAEPYLALGMFSGTVTGLLNWTESRINVALGADEPRARDHAARELPGLLEHLPTIDRFDRILAAAAG